MTTLELKTKKEKLTMKKYPCIFTPEEIWSGADEVIKAHRSGDKSQFVPFEEIKRKVMP